MRAGRAGACAGLRRWHANAPPCSNLVGAASTTAPQVATSLFGRDRNFQSRTLHSTVVNADGASDASGEFPKLESATTEVQRIQQELMESMSLKRTPRSASVSSLLQQCASRPDMKVSLEAMARLRTTDYECSPVTREKSSSSARASCLRSNVARPRANAAEYAGVLAVGHVDAMKAKAVTDSSRTARFIAQGTVPDLRLIHETAVVHPDAVLGEGVEIGAFCTVGPQVKLGNGCKVQPSCHIFGDTQLGENCVLSTGAVVGADIPGHTVIGDNNAIGHYAVVGVKCQDMKYKEGDECFLYIGDNNDIREFASIHRSSKPTDNTVLGDYNLIMGSCHVAHDCKLGNGNILANGTLLGGHVVVEDLVHTGGGVAVHQFCNIGSYAFLAGGSMVDRDVPMYMMVAGDRAQLRGLNLEGMRRCGFTDPEIRSVRKVYEKLFMDSTNSCGLEERLEELEQDEGLAAVPVVTAMLQSVRGCFEEKRRGICRFKQLATV